MSTIQAHQDAAHDADHDYAVGSPHLTHAHLRTRIVGALSDLVHELFRDRAEVRVLEIGAGHGPFTDHLLALGARVTATEMSAASAAHLARRYARNPNARILHDADGTLLAGLDERFDLVVASAVLHHIPDYLAAVESWSALVEPGGALFTVADPLYYPRQSRANRLAERGAFYAWRLTLPGGRMTGIRNVLRRGVSGFDETVGNDMVEYHVLRDGVDEQALMSLLRKHFCDVDIWRYWSTPAPSLQRLGDRFADPTNFSLTARGHR